MRRQGAVAGDRLVYRIALWAQVMLGAGLAAGLLLLALSVAGPPGLDTGGHIVLGLAGLLMVSLGAFGLRIRVRVDRRGVHLYSLRTITVPTSDIASLVIRPVPGGYGLNRGAVAVVRRDGSELRLDPTLAVRPSAGPMEAALRARIGAMYQVLGVTP
jgi:hypothetical protein